MICFVVLKPLHFMKKRVEILFFFLITLSLSSIVGKTALHWSASVDNEKATALLLKNNAKKDAQDSKVSYPVK